MYTHTCIYTHIIVHNNIIMMMMIIIIIFVAKAWSASGRLGRPRTRILTVSDISTANIYTLHQ